MQEGSTFVPSSCLLHEGTTAPPLMLTESELIELMDTHGIGVYSACWSRVCTLLYMFFHV